TLHQVLERLSRNRPVVFPVHPRTRERLLAAGVTLETGGDLRFSEPVGYVEMLGLIAGAALVITDSGGLQEETTFLGVPCITVRPNTERPITCDHGTNRLVALRPEAILAAAERAIARRSPARPLIERWDGRAAERIVRVLCDNARFDDAFDTIAPAATVVEPLTAALDCQVRRLPGASMPCFGAVECCGAQTCRPPRRISSFTLVNRKRINGIACTIGPSGWLQPYCCPPAIFAKSGNPSHGHESEGSPAGCGGRSAAEARRHWPSAARAGGAPATEPYSAA